MITSMMGRMADAEKLSIPQLQMAIKNGTIPAYIGVPLLQDKVKQHQQAMAMQQAQQQQGQDQVPLAAQVMQEADQYRGIDELPTNLPTEEDERAVNDEYANGGIIAFAEPTSENNNSRVTDPDKNSDPLVERLQQDDPKAFGLLMRDVPTDKLTEAQFDMLPKEQQEIRIRDYGGDRFTGAMSKAMGTALSAIPMTAGAAVMTPVSIAAQYGTEVLNTKPMQYFLRKAGIMEPGQTEIKNKIPTIEDMLGKKGIAGIPAQAFSHLDSGIYAPTLRETLRARDGRGETIGPQGLNPIPFAEPETIGPQGLTALPRAKNVQIAPNQPPAGQRGAAPTGQRSAAPTGTTTSAGDNRGNGAGGNVPSTLREAEAVAGKSPAAAQAVSEVNRYMAMLEKNGESVGREKKEAFYMALISGGLAAAGGTSPNALANIAAGMVPATQQYQKAISDIRKDDRARVEKLLAAGMGKEKLALELRKLGIEEKKVDALVNYYNARADASGSGGSAAQDKIYAKNQVTYVQATRNFNTAIGDIDNKIAKVKESTFYGQDPTSKSPVIAGKIKAANDAVAAFERRKREINREHQGFIKQLDINVPDYENRPASGGDIDLSQFFKKS